MHVYMYICTYAHMYACICVYVYIMYVCIYVYMVICIYVYGTISYGSVGLALMAIVFGHPAAYVCHTCYTLCTHVLAYILGRLVEVRLFHKGLRPTTSTGLPG